jgi:hypothetical protein
VPDPVKASDIPKIPLKTWEDIGDNAANITRTSIRDGVLGGSYSKSYAENKKARKAAPRGSSQSSTQTKFVDLTLTGKMLDELKTTKFDKNSATIGLSGHNAEKARHNAKRDSDIFDDKVLALIMKDTFARVGRKIDSNIKKFSRKDLVINVGK